MIVDVNDRFFPCHHPRLGDPLHRDAGDFLTTAAEYWMPACASMTTEVT
jgi:hypothetical protein